IPGLNVRIFLHVSGMHRRLSDQSEYTPHGSWKDYRMKLLADENIPASVVRVLKEDGYDIRWIRIESPGISDIEVMRYATRKNGYS
ncbi:MAG: DUF5615 family PIN-like protein, partial [Methanoregula sp.]|nr:DUF5615 family PIN-like protein [Methanoregula sp.]